MGRGSKLITLGGKAFYVMEGVNIAGMAVVLSAQGMQQVQSLRNGVVSELAHVEAEIREISRTNLADPRLAGLKARREQLIAEGRGAVTQVFTDMAAQQALFLAAGAIVHQVGPVASRAGPLWRGQRGRHATANVAARQQARLHANQVGWVLHDLIQ